MDQQDDANTPCSHTFVRQLVCLDFNLPTHPLHPFYQHLSLTGFF